MSVQHAKTYKPVQEYVDRFKSGEFDLGAVYVGMVAEMAEVLWISPRAMSALEMHHGPLSNR